MLHPSAIAALKRSAAAPDGEWEGWMVAAMAGDARAYDRLLRAMLPMLRAIARRRIADRAEAEDAVQDALLTIHKLRSAYDPQRPIRPWIAAICERRCIDRLRRSSRQRQREARIDDVSEAHLATDGEAVALGGILRGQVRAAIRELPRVQQAAVTLSRFQELSLAEASAQSGLTVASLKIGMHRAVRRLRSRLAVAG